MGPGPGEYQHEKADTLVFEHHRATEWYHNGRKEVILDPANGHLLGLRQLLCGHYDKTHLLCDAQRLMDQLFHVNTHQDQDPWESCARV